MEVCLSCRSENFRRRPTTMARSAKRAAGHETIAGFHPLAVAYAPVAGAKHVVHTMYVRAHTGDKDDARLPGGRTLFVVNVPTDATHPALRTLFRKAGAVESIVVHDRAAEESAPTDAPADTKGQPPSVVELPALVPTALHASGANAHIVFLDASSLDRALQLPAKFAAKPYPWPQPTSKTEAPSDAEPLGLAYLLTRYRMHRPEHDAIKAHVDSAIARYAWIREHPQWLMEQRRRGDQATSAGVGIQGVSTGPGGELLDEDGFTIVQKGSKYGRSGGDEGSGTFAAITPEFEEMMRLNPDAKKKKELVDFYRFQFREKKRQRTSRLTHPRIRGTPRAVRIRQGEDCAAQIVDAIQAVRCLTHR